MRIGVVFPTVDVVDPSAVRDVAQAVEHLGFRHLVAWEHVAGADPTNRAGWDGPSTLQSIHGPCVLFGFLAAVTRRLELVTGVLVLPQRQTVLVAKQAAEVDVLSVDACGQDVVTFEGTWHQVHGMGIRPLPRQRPIPIWVGGQADASLRRVAALGDGWMSPLAPDEAEQDGYLDRLRAYVCAEGRDPADVGIEALVSIGEDLHGAPGPQRRDPEEWRQDVDRWRALGATHLSVSSMGAGPSAQDHIDALQRFKDVLR